MSKSRHTKAEMIAALKLGGGGTKGGRCGAGSSRCRAHLPASSANRIKIAASIRDKIGISGVGSRSGGNSCTPLFSPAFLSLLISSP